MDQLLEKVFSSEVYVFTTPRKSTQVVQAEAAISVNRWRVRKIEEELRQAVPLAPPRAAHAGCIVGHRVIYYGGWGAQTERGELLVLDIEDPREKGRRYVIGTT